MTARLTFAEKSRRTLASIALASGWLLVIMAAVTCFDVVARKTGIPAEEVGVLQQDSIREARCRGGAPCCPTRWPSSSAPRAGPPPAGSR
jgi:hypothetical protein